MHSWGEAAPLRASDLQTVLLKPQGGGQGEAGEDVPSADSKQHPGWTSPWGAGARVWALGPEALSEPGVWASDRPGGLVDG